MKTLGKLLLTGLILFSPFAKKLEAQSSRNIEFNQIYLTSCINKGVCSDKSKDVTLEDRVDLNLVVKAKENGETIYFSDVKNLEIEGLKIDSSKISKWPSKDVLIRWAKVSSTDNCYSNWENGKFHWKTPKYEENNINEYDKWNFSINNPKNKKIDADLGTSRYTVEFVYGGDNFSTKGKESTNYLGITDDVHRISFRQDDSFVGWLTSFLNLPYIYGSVPEQVDNYVGTDCADLIIGAKRKMGENLPYTYVGGLNNISEEVVNEENLSTDGSNFYNNNKILKWGEDIKPGDLIIFGEDFHVGVLSKDKGILGQPDGVLNEYDLMIHTFADYVSEERIGRLPYFAVRRLD